MVIRINIQVGGGKPFQCVPPEMNVVAFTMGEALPRISPFQR